MTWTGPGAGLFSVPAGPTTAVAAELPSRATLRDGRYVVEGVLGRGGFGITYAAADVHLGRAVAIKELFPGEAVRIGGRVVPPMHEAAGFAEARSRVLREASVLARFSDPGIVRVYEVFEEANTVYLVMERLNGRTLHEVMVGIGRPLVEPDVVELAARVGHALATVHDAGVLHRDVNPANVIVEPTGRVALIDFGLARDYLADDQAPMTRMVTPGYAPPEQYSGNGPVGPSTDIYGLAATLYRALVGRAPLLAPDRQGGTRLLPPQRANPAVSKLTSDGIMDGLELEPGHRPQTVAAFLARMGIAPTPAPGPPPTTVPGAGAGGRALSTVVVSDPGLSAGPRPGATAVPDRASPSLPVPPPPSMPPVPEPGPHWKVVVPAIVATAACGAAAPIAAFLALALVVLPGVATAGDIVVYRRLRRRADERLRLRHKVGLPIYAAGRFVRNIGATVLSGLPALLIEALVVAAALVAEGTGAAGATETWALRPAGAGAAVALAVPVFRDRYRFRAPVIGDKALALGLDGARLSSAGAALWALAALLALAAIGLRPDPWPL